jgi:hypothetical protein
MAASANAQVLHEGLSNLGERAYPMDKAAMTLYVGQFICNDTTGYAVAASDTAAYPFLGICSQYQDAQKSAAATSDGDNYVKVFTKGLHRVTVTSVAITDINKPVWLSDDNTLVLTPTNIFVGYVREYVTTSTAYVELDPLNPPPMEIITFSIPASTASGTKVSNETFAPSRDCKIMKAWAAALAYPDYATSVADVDKYNLDDTADKAVVDAIDIDGKTAKQRTALALSGTAANLLLTPGDTLRASATVGATEATASSGLTISVKVQYYGLQNQE